MERPKGNGFPSLEILVLSSRTGDLSASEPLCLHACRLCPFPSHQLILHDHSTGPLELVTQAFPVSAANGPTTARTLLNTYGGMYVVFLAWQFEEKSFVWS